jgi:hypothetical protein
MLSKNWKQNRKRGEELGRMYWADTDDKVRFTYNGLVREGFVDYIWKWHSTFSGCFMTINFRDGMEDVEYSSYKNFSLNQVTISRLSKGVHSMDFVTLGVCIAALSIMVQGGGNRKWISLMYFYRDLYFDNCSK